MYTLNIFPLLSQTGGLYLAKLFQQQLNFKIVKKNFKHDNLFAYLLVFSLGHGKLCVMFILNNYVHFYKGCCTAPHYRLKTHVQWKQESKLDLKDLLGGMLAECNEQDSDRVRIHVWRTTGPNRNRQIKKTQSREYSKGQSWVKKRQEYTPKKLIRRAGQEEKTWEAKQKAEQVRLSCHGKLATPFPRKHCKLQT